MQLRAVAAAARVGSVSRAAQAVSLTQPAVTQAIARIEARLGCRLFERHSGGVRALPAAIALADRIDRVTAYVGSTRVTAVQMRALDALARHGGYADAAAALGLAPPSLHRAIGDLSIGLRKRLVERSGSRIVITAAALKLVRGFRLAASEFDAGLDEVAALLGQESGTITIGAMPLSRARLLPRAITAFHAEHPDFAIRVIEGSFADLVEPLRDGVIDVLAGALRSGLRGLETHSLFDDTPLVVARAGHPLAERRVTLGDLAQFPWTISAPGTPLRHLWEAMFAQEGIATPRVPVECGSVITIREILRSSDFLTLLSLDQVAAELAAGWLAPLQIERDAAARTIGLTWREHWRPTPLQQRFIGSLIGPGT